MESNSLVKRKTGYVLIFAVFFIINGCAHRISNFKIESLPESKIPLRVGLYLRQNFSSYKCKYEGDSNLHSLLIGEGLCREAEKTFKEIYTDVVRLDDNSDILKENVKFIISPEIETMRTELELLEFQITCKWTITGADGKIYYMNTVTGVSKNAESVFDISYSMTNAVKDHYEKLVRHMLSTKWWEYIK